MTEYQARMAALAGVLAASLCGTTAVTRAAEGPEPVPEPPPAAEETEPQPTMDEILVIAPRLKTRLKDLGENVSVIMPEEISDRPATTPEAMMDEQKGLDVQSGGFPGRKARVNARGLPGCYGAQRVLVLQDGRPVNEEYQGDFDFRVLPSDHIERVEVLRGPGSALYGSQAMGAVVNLVSRRGTPGKPVTEITGISGDFDTYITSIRHGGGTGSFDYFVTGRHVESDGYLANLAGDLRSWKSDHGTANLGYTLDGGGECRLFADYSEGLGMQAAFDEVIRRSSMGFELSTPLAGRTPGDLTMRAYRNDFGMSIDSTIGPPQPTSRYDQFTWGGQAIYTTDLSDRNRLAVGIDVDRKDVATDELMGAVSEDRVALGVYVQDEFDLSEDLTVTAGLRWDWDDDFQGEVSPRVGAVWKPRETTKIHGLVGKAYRVPSFSDLYLPTTPFSPTEFYVGNPDLEPEEMWSVEAGWSENLNPSWTVSTTVFYSQVKDGWYHIPDPAPTYRPHNIAEMRVLGVELETEFEIVEGLSGFVRYTFTDAEFAEFDATGLDIEGNQLEEVAPHNASLGLRYEHGSGAVVGAVARYADNRYGDVENTGPERMRRFGVLDLYFSAPLGRSKVFAEIKNVTDVSYAELDVSEPEPGRTFFVGMTVSF